MRATCFKRALKTGSTHGVANKWLPEQVRSVDVEVDDRAHLPELLVAAFDACGYGNGQSGIFEIQTDLGIWSGRTVDGHRRPLYRGTSASTFKLCPHATFTTWEQLEAEEQVA